jgi:uncharacterized RDD family membrane protein YckC
MQTTVIRTAQNININFPIASLGERILAFLIDLLIKFGYIFIINLLGIFFAISTSSMDSWSKNALVILCLFPIIFYTLILEIFFNGQTLGKKYMGIKVITTEGYQCSVLNYFTRWMFNLLDIYIFNGGFGVISCAISKQNQRFGDMAAQTIVVKTNIKKFVDKDLFKEMNEQHRVLFPTVITLSDKDINLITHSFQKSYASKKYETIEILKNKIEDVLKIKKPSKMTNIDFIKTILEDYAHLTKD